MTPSCSISVCRRRTASRCSKEWRAAGRTMPVLILTARDRWSDKVQGFDAGADDYVAKPFHIEEVWRALRALLRRATGHASSELTCGPVRLDTRSGRVLVDGNQIKLTSHEYRLLVLSHASCRAGRSRSELVEHLYDQDFDRDSNTIEVFVGRLRKEARHRHHPDDARARLCRRGAGERTVPRQGRQAGNGRPENLVMRSTSIRGIGRSPPGFSFGGGPQFDHSGHRRHRTFGALSQIGRDAVRRTARVLLAGPRRRYRLAERGKTTPSLSSSANRNSRFRCLAGIRRSPGSTATSRISEFAFAVCRRLPQLAATGVPAGVGGARRGYVQGPGRKDPAHRRTYDRYRATKASILSRSRRRPRRWRPKSTVSNSL